MCKHVSTINCSSLASSRMCTCTDVCTSNLSSRWGPSVENWGSLWSAEPTSSILTVSGKSAIFWNWSLEITRLAAVTGSRTKKGRAEILSVWYYDKPKSAIPRRVALSRNGEARQNGLVDVVQSSREGPQSKYRISSRFFFGGEKGALTWYCARINRGPKSLANEPYFGGVLYTKKRHVPKLGFWAKLSFWVVEALGRSRNFGCVFFEGGAT